MAFNYKWVGSPNYTVANNRKITKVVCHWMAGTLAGTDSVFKNPNTDVSAHYGIENNTVHQYVKEKDIAWHAKQANSFSIGIEHSGGPGRPITKTTYATSAKLVAKLLKSYKLKTSDIVPHSKYVNTQCPGTFNLSAFRKQVDKILKGEEMTAQDKKDLALGRRARKGNWEKQVVAAKQLADKMAQLNQTESWLKRLVKYAQGKR